MKVLIIEDEKLLADSIRSVLERNGFEAECVYDGEAGVEYAELGIYENERLAGGPGGAGQALRNPHPDAHRPLRIRGSN